MIEGEGSRSLMEKFGGDRSIRGWKEKVREDSEGKGNRGGDKRRRWEALD